jgi:hypothetical protein
MEGPMVAKGLARLRDICGIGFPADVLHVRQMRAQMRQSAAYVQDAIPGWARTKCCAKWRRPLSAIPIGRCTASYIVGWLRAAYRPCFRSVVNAHTLIKTARQLAPNVMVAPALIRCASASSSRSTRRALLSSGAHARRLVARHLPVAADPADWASESRPEYGRICLLPCRRSHFEPRD